MMSVEMFAQLSDMRCVSVFNLNVLGVFSIIVINISALIHSLFQDNRKLTLLTALEIFYMQVGNKIGHDCIMLSASCLGFS